VVYLKIHFLHNFSVADILFSRDFEHVVVHFDEALGGCGEDVQHFVVVDLDEEGEEILARALRDCGSGDQFFVLEKFEGLG
jgi:hypothetical protein